MPTLQRPPQAARWGEDRGARTALRSAGPARPAGPRTPRPAQHTLLFSTAHLRGMAERARPGVPAAPQGPAHGHTPGVASPTCLWKSCEEPRSARPEQRRSCPLPPGLGRGSRGRPRLSGFCLHLLGGAGPMTPLLCVSSSICDPP